MSLSQRFFGRFSLFGQASLIFRAPVRPFSAHYQHQKPSNWSAHATPMAQGWRLAATAPTSGTSKSSTSPPPGGPRFVDHLAVSDLLHCLKELANCTIKGPTYPHDVGLVLRMIRAEAPKMNAQHLTEVVATLSKIDDSNFIQRDPEVWEALATRVKELLPRQLSAEEVGILALGFSKSQGGDTPFWEALAQAAIRYCPTAKKRDLVRYVEGFSWMGYYKQELWKPLENALLADFPEDPKDIAKCIEGFEAVFKGSLEFWCRCGAAALAHPKELRTEVVSMCISSWLEAHFQAQDITKKDDDSMDDGGRQKKERK